MSEAYSTAAADSSKPAALQPPTTAGRKPAKPHPDFPLTAHPAGYWCKKIRGKLYYFGPWSDPDGALAKYLDQKEALHAGRKPRSDADAPTVRDAANAFLNHKDALVDSGELSPRTRAKYQEVCDLVVKEFGKGRLVADLGPDDFAGLRKKMTKKWGALRVRDFIQHVRSIFKHAFDAELIDRPVRFGPGFARPSKKTLRLQRAQKGLRMFTAEEIREMICGAIVVGKEGPALVQAGMALRAMILLGVNCGLGNEDCGTLPLSALDLDAGWVNHHRPKTGITRRCSLWPETVQAIREALAARPEAKDPAHVGLVFLTKHGGPWSQLGDSPVSKEMRKLLARLGISGHRSFYALRHTLETVGGEAKDQVALDAIMGHAKDDMASAYREKISDERLKAVADRVRAWLFPSAGGQTNEPIKSAEEK